MNLCNTSSGTINGKQDLSSDVPFAAKNNNLDFGQSNNAKRKNDSTKPMLFIFLILFTDLIAFTIILPLFPAIIEHYAEKDKNSTEKDASLEIIKDLMEWLKVLFSMPDKKRYNAVLIGGKLT